LLERRHPVFQAHEPEDGPEEREPDPPDESDQNRRPIHRRCPVVLPFAVTYRQARRVWYCWLVAFALLALAVFTAPRPGPAAPPPARRPGGLPSPPVRPADWPS